MWSFIKRLLAGPAPAEDPLRETVSFDDAGLTRSSELLRAMGQREFWPWHEIQEFGFRYTQAMFPDPWYGDYMESLWFVRVPSDGGGLMAIEFDGAVLDIARLPPALLRNLPGLDMDVLRAGLAAASRGPRHFEGEGDWVAWRRAAPPAATPGPGPA
jgi:hypothetical protein